MSTGTKRLRVVEARLREVVAGTWRVEVLPGKYVNVRTNVYWGGMPVQRVAAFADVLLNVAERLRCTFVWISCYQWDERNQYWRFNTDISLAVKPGEGTK